MHTLIFPIKDTYITNQSAYVDKNFGLDEIMRVGSYSQYTNTRVYTHTYTYPDNQYFDCLLVDSFAGTITGSFSGSAAYTSGSILGTGVFSSSYFTGNVSGSVYGTDGGAPITNDNYSGALSAFSGSISSSAGGVDGYITSSLTAYYFVTYTGYLSGSSGAITGYLSGSNTANEQGYEVLESKVISRALLKFNIDAISSSMASGDIVDPRFKLKMKIAKEEELPLEYKIYVFPVSQSWERGTGYLSDGGSDDGASWNWRSFYSSSAWYLPTTASDYLPTDDYLNTASYGVKSFGRGGGTWYYTDSLAANVKCTQSFNYPETSDLYIDVTPIVRAWITGSLPNEGFIVMSSVENQSGSNGVLTFFSRDTNTVFSPTLDVMWDDVVWTTGSVDNTSSVSFGTISSGISASVVSGSSLTIAGGVSGIFSGSVFLVTAVHYITASNVTVTGNVNDFIGIFTGSFSGPATVYGLFTGSGQFSASYFAGLLDGTPAIISSASVSASNIQGLITSSVIMQTAFGEYKGELTSSAVYLNGTATGYYLDTSSYYIGGIVIGTGLSGNIIGMPVQGSITGTMTILPVLVTGPCGNNFSASIVTASFTSGIFSGSTFGAYFTDDFKFENAYLSGSWTQDALLGARVSIPIPSGIDPYAYAYVTGVYVNGKALGTYTLFNAYSASFNGQFVNGNLLGGSLNVQLSGSVVTSSYQYTSSITVTSSSLQPVSTTLPFAAVVQNLRPIYTAGNVVRINVFGREEQPLKNFTRRTQMTQYLYPKYLPTSSYYSIKDNETEEIIIDFDNYTRLSCDPTGNFFMLDTTAFAQERNYRLRLKVEDAGAVYVFDNGDVFKIVR